MTYYACICGYREQGESAPKCEECASPMYHYEPPIVPDNWYTIGHILRRSPEEVAVRAKHRGRR